MFNINILPPRRSKQFVEIRKILQEEGDEAATKYFKSLTRKQQKALLDNALEIIADNQNQLMIASMLKAEEDQQLTLGFSDQ